MTDAAGVYYRRLGAPLPTPPVCAIPLPKGLGEFRIQPQMPGLRMGSHAHVRFHADEDRLQFILMLADLAPQALPCLIDTSCVSRPDTVHP
jgi:hypothetical protein